ncbi:UNVERIFIED_CONTAM: ATP-dependent DNA ligase domain-containing protein [Hammondia hammondi]|eukprot:XP_008884730.1 ATP-dependent DNA ligase domain-containing protein [Hammondia hammondi]
MVVAFPSSRSSGASCEDILFAEVCTVLDRLADPFAKATEKMQFFARYLHRFSCLPVSSLYPLLRLLLPQLDRRRPPAQLKQPLLARIYAQVFALPPAAAARLKLYKDPAAATASAGGGPLVARAGDFASFVAASVQERVGRRQPSVTVKELNRDLDLVALAGSFSEKSVILHGLLPQLTVNEHKWCMRILMKEVKMGGLSGERLLTLLHADARKIVNQVSDLKSTLEVIDEEKAEAVHAKRGGSEGVEQGVEMEGPFGEKRDSLRLLFQPLRPMLAQVVRPVAADVAAVLFGECGKGKHGTDSWREREKEGTSPRPAPTNASVARVYFVERKYDGERLLAHIDKNASSTPVVRLLTRRGRDYTALYGGDLHHRSPSLSSSASSSSTSSSGFRWPKRERFLSEDEVRGESGQRETRGGKRTRKEPEGLAGLAATLVEALRGSQAILDGELLAWDDDLESFLPFGTNKSVAAAETARCHLSYVIFDVLYYRNSEGDEYSLLNMKLQDRKSGGWFKLKPHLGSLPDTLDLIAIGAFFAEGRRRREVNSSHLIDHCSHFLLGVLEGEGGPEAKRVKSFCKVGTGFSLETLRDIRDHLRLHCRRFQATQPPPWFDACTGSATSRVDVTWPPSCSFVMEVKGAELAQGNEFDVGATLRFPVAVRPFRRDKAWHEAMSETALHDFCAVAEECGGRLLSQRFSPSGAAAVSPDRSLAGSSTERRNALGLLYQHSGETASEESDSADAGMGAGSDRDLANGPAPAGESSHGFSPNQRPQKSLLSSPSRLHVKPASGFSRMALLAPFRAADTSAIQPCSSALKETDIWVLAGDEEAFPKASLEALVAHLGGKVSHTLSPSVTHILADRPSFRTRTVAAAVAQLATEQRDFLSTLSEKRKRRISSLRSLSSRSSPSSSCPSSRFSSSLSSAASSSPRFSVRVPPVLHFRWLLECAEREEAVALRPSLVIHGTPETERLFSRHFDVFGDAFLEDETPTERGLGRLSAILAHALEVAENQKERRAREGVRAYACRERGEATASAETERTKSGAVRRGREETDGKLEREVEEESLFDISDKEANAVRRELEAFLKSDPDSREAPARAGNTLEPLNMRLYVAPEDLAWRSLSLQQLKKLQNEDVVETSTSSDCTAPSSPPLMVTRYSPSFQQSSCAVSLSCFSSRLSSYDKLLHTLASAYRASLVAQCCHRGARLVNTPAAATHVLLPFSAPLGVESGAMNSEETREESERDEGKNGGNQEESRKEKTGIENQTDAEQEGRGNKFRRDRQASRGPKLITADVLELMLRQKCPGKWKEDEAELFQNSA